MFLHIKPFALLLAVVSPISALATEVPESFGSGHDNPRTAYPSPVPDGLPACTVEVLQHGFADFEPARATLDASACPGPWHKVILRIDGKVKGRQYDRIGHVAVGGITIFRTSTPEPSQEGITWQVEKDVTAYAPLFTSPQPVEMMIGNVVNDTYTGIFDVYLRVQFYRADAEHPAAATADQVLALDQLREDGQDTLGTVVIPANTGRVVAEVYATGSGGGCEEFWYFAAPTGDYWCQASHGPYREVQVLIDGRLAGIAAPYPHIYTGGWSNPFLWYTIPAPRAFNILPIQYELTPFVGLLDDGEAHEIRFRVVGLDGGREGWKLMPNVQIWTAPDGQPVKVQLLQAGIVKSSSGSTLAPDGDGQRLRQDFERHFVARARISNGRDGEVQISVERALRGHVNHSWAAREDDRDDRLKAHWFDTQTITHRPADGQPVTRQLRQEFGLDGSVVSVPTDDGAPRLTTTLDITDATYRRVDAEGDSQKHTHTRDRFIGTASWTRGVSRERRNATAESRQSWRSREYHGGMHPHGGNVPVRCREREIASRNGVFTLDTSVDVCSGQAAPADGN